MSGERVQALNSVSFLESWLAENTALPQENRKSLATVVSKLAAEIKKSPNTTIGISGAPGSGKSTLTRALTHHLNAQSVTACHLSLDDYYLSRKERERLAIRIHPSFRQRGVPGTHDLPGLLHDLDAVRSGAIEGLRLPSFDKSADDRLPESRWRSLPAAPQLVLLEGWCVGAKPPKPHLAGQDTANSGSTTPRADAPKRRQIEDKARDLEVARAWNEMYRELGKRLDRVWYIRVPDWNCVLDWRWQQEVELPHRNLRSRPDVEHFLSAFEPIVSYMQRTHSEWADLTIESDRQHHFHLPDPERKQRETD